MSILSIITIFSIPEFTWNGITQHNRNPILGFTEGADGLKTGHTEAAGYGLVASAKRVDERLIAVLTGMKSKKERRGRSPQDHELGLQSLHLKTHL